MTDERAMVRRFSVALNSIDNLYERISRKFGYKANMMWLLYALDDGEAKSQKHLCEQWLFRPTTLNTIVKECEASGYVTLEHIPGKRRELNIRLTDAGREYAHKFLDPLYRAEEQALAGTPNAEEMIASLEALFAKLDEQFDRIYELIEKKD